MTVREFFQEAGLLNHGDAMDREKCESLVQLLADRGFDMSVSETNELFSVFGLMPHSLTSPVAASVGVVEFAQWLRGPDRLASRLREHLLGVSPSDLRWHAPGEQFLERLSLVISSIETRASQMIENELPPEKKERFFVDVISQPWDRENLKIDGLLCTRLQRGLLSEERYRQVCETQVDGEPRRETQNWVSSEKHDEFMGKVKVVHHLPPPPSVLPELLDGYFACLDRMMDDETMDPIVCATIAKIAFNTLHPLVDGNGRVQRLIFQLVLFKFGFLPRMNVPVSVIMLQDRTGYEVMQQKHVDQMMVGVLYKELTSKEEGDTFEHILDNESVMSVYQYQDFTFAVSSMIKLMEGTLPVIAAKAYFLQRFDWRVDELLKGDALLPARAATKIAKVFKNEGHGLSISQLGRLLFLDGWQIGFKRILRFLAIARHPDDMFGLRRLQESFEQWRARSLRRLWIMRTGQMNADRTTARLRWVGVSLDRFVGSQVALKRALAVSKPGDTVVAVHYPKDMSALLSVDLYPKLANDILADVEGLRNQVLDMVQGVVNDMNIEAKGVIFRALVGASPAYRPAHALCEDAKVAEVKPYRIYVGYDKDEHHRTFTDYVVRNAPCDVAIVKGEFSQSGITRWVGISSRNFDISGSALVKAFAHSKPGDRVVALHYPVNPFEEEGLSSVFSQHYTSVTDDHLDVIMGNIESRVLERAERIAETHRKPGVEFKTLVGMHTSEPHHRIVRDAAEGVPGADASVARPHTIYVGYNRRRDRNRLVEPHKLYDVAEYIVRHAPCNVVVVKESQEAMALRLRTREGTL